MSVVQRNTNKAVDTTHRLLNNLANTTKESSLKVRIARLWDNFHINKKNELLSIDMVLIDEESNYIHATVPKKSADSFRKKSLQEGKIYVITKFAVSNKKKSMLWLKAILQCYNFMLTPNSTKKTMMMARSLAIFSNLSVTTIWRLELAKIYTQI